MTSTSRRDVNIRRMKFDPIKPAPPVTSSFTLFSFDCVGVYGVTNPLIFLLDGTGWSAASGNLIRPGFRNQICSSQKRLECTCICPPAVQSTVCEATFLKVHVVYVSDFKFVTPTRLSLANLLKHSRVVKIDPGNRITGFRFLGFFFNA